MKKFILFILFTISLQAQDALLLLSGSNYYSYVFVNVGATVSDDQIIFSGASTRTKTTKALGTNRAATR